MITDYAHALRAARTHGWNTPEARKLLTEATVRYRNLAHATGTDPAEAASYAYEAWRSASNSIVDAPGFDPFAYARPAVARALGAEQEAARKLTSREALRRRGTREAHSVIRGEDESAQATAEEQLARTGEENRALRGLEQVLIMVGFDDAQRRQFTVELMEELDGTDVLHAANTIRRLRTRQVAHRYPITQTQWNTLISLLLGSRRGRPGLLQLMAVGHPAPFFDAHVSGCLVALSGTRKQVA